MSDTTHAPVPKPPLGPKRWLEGPALDEEIGRALGGPEKHPEWYWWSGANWSGWHEEAYELPKDVKPVAWAGPAFSTDRQKAMTLLDSWHGDWEIRRQSDHYKVTLYEPSMQGDEWDASLPLAICRIRLRANGWPLAE